MQSAKRPDSKVALVLEGLAWLFATDEELDKLSNLEKDEPFETSVVLKRVFPQKEVREFFKEDLVLPRLGGGKKINYNEQFADQLNTDKHNHMTPNKEVSTIDRFRDPLKGAGKKEKSKSLFKARRGAKLADHPALGALYARMPFINPYHLSWLFARFNAYGITSEVTMAIVETSLQNPVGTQEYRSEELPALNLAVYLRLISSLNTFQPKLDGDLDDQINRYLDRHDKYLRDGNRMLDSTRALCKVLILDYMQGLEGMQKNGVMGFNDLRVAFMKTYLLSYSRDFDREVKRSRAPAQVAQPALRKVRSTPDVRLEAVVSRHEVLRQQKLAQIRDRLLENFVPRMR